MTPEPARCPTCGHTTDAHGTTGCTYIYVIDGKDVVCSCSPDVIGDTQPLHPDWLTSTIAPTLDPAARFEQVLDELARILDAHGYTASMVASLNVGGCRICGVTAGKPHTDYMHRWYDPTHPDHSSNQPTKDTPS